MSFEQHFKLVLLNDDIHNSYKYWSLFINFLQLLSWAAHSPIKSWLKSTCGATPRNTPKLEFSCWTKNWTKRYFFLLICSEKLFFEFFFSIIFFLIFRLQQLTCLLWQLTWPNCLVTNLNTWASLLKVPSNQDTTDTRQYSRILWRSELLLMHYA